MPSGGLEPRNSIWWCHLRRRRRKLPYDSQNRKGSVRAWENNRTDATPPSPFARSFQQETQKCQEQDFTKRT